MNTCYIFDTTEVKQIYNRNTTNKIVTPHTKIMTKKDLNKLKKSLPKGYRDLIAEKCNCSIGLVDMVLAGTRKNIEVLTVAVNLAQSHKIELEALANQIKSL
jgi:hypothetical protein